MDSEVVLVLNHGVINALKTKVNLNYVHLNIQFIPRSKHTTSQLYKPVS
jgi:hypothetical protein